MNKQELVNLITKYVGNVDTHTRNNIVKLIESFNHLPTLTQPRYEVNYVWEIYLIKLGQRSREYRYDITTIYNNIDYFKKCWSSGLSEYKSLEWFGDYLDDKVRNMYPTNIPGSDEFNTINNE